MKAGPSREGPRKGKVRASGKGKMKKSHHALLVRLMELRRQEQAAARAEIAERTRQRIEELKRKNKYVVLGKVTT